MQRILVATDGSDIAGRAVAFAARLAAHEQCPLTVVSVVDYFNASQPDVVEYSHQEHDTPEGALNVWAEQTVAHATRDALRLGAPQVEAEIHSGEAALSIVEAAQKNQADVIVMGKRGRGPIASALLGSVSRQVTATAPCAVIVVP
ncbi:universal stress protein [Desertibaculum subflavum]|uniref:universal stress protein n=1 Tax=Desertibaculum subflavum TaxID=2268458 RepID=UPI000E665782